MIGKVVSHYRIEEKLGSGGMAVVYRAVDVRLDRRVALKFLPRSSSDDDEARRQLQREAKTASGLDHPNICTIYDISETDEGVLFIAMAYYDGETLQERLRRGPLEWTEALQVVAQVASGLAEAHRHRIVHRDIKPANLLVTPEGRAKILDFGIARLDQHTGREKSVLGTVPYMSPEQLRGLPTDHRTDIWSLGVVLYQLLTARRPFVGRSRDDVRRAILSEPPEPLTDYAQGEELRLQRILHWCLAKDPDERYNDAEELRLELESPSGSMPRGPALDTGPPAETSEITQVESPIPGLAAPAGGTLPSIAVLPFNDLSAGGDHAYLASGIAEELVNRLARVEGLRVAGRTSTQESALASLGVEELGRRLGVANVLEGSVRVAGDALRMSVRLVDAVDGSIRWSETFDRGLRDLFEIQDEIARHIAAELELRLLGRRLEDHNYEAHYLYMKGRHSWNQRTIPGFEQAISYFKAALAEAPDLARAHAGLADAYAMLGIYGARRPSAVMAPAVTAAQEALTLDPTLAEAFASRGCVRASYDWDFPSAANDFRRAIELDPQYPTAYQWYAMNCLIPKRHFDDALKQLSRAVELDPMSLAIKISLGLYFYYTDKPQQAVEEYQRVLEIDPDFPQALIFMAHALRQAGELERAVDVALRAAELTRGNPAATVALATTHAALGDLDRARWLLEKILEPKEKTFVPPTYLAQIYAALDERSLALSVLDRACHLRTSELIWLAVEPLYEPLRPNPRFRDLLREVGLQPRW
ncbi:MAG: protein kinase [Acidobacteriota bacterium]